jgi:hypothetical protein
VLPCLCIKRVNAEQTAPSLSSACSRYPLFLSFPFPKLSDANICCRLFLGHFQPQKERECFQCQIMKNINVRYLSGRYIYIYGKLIIDQILISNSDGYQCSVAAPAQCMRRSYFARTFWTLNRLSHAAGKNLQSVSLRVDMCIGYR